MDSSDDEECSSLEEEEAALARGEDSPDEGGVEETEGAAPEASTSGRPVIYRRDDIHEKLEDFMWENVPWNEAQVITSTRSEQVKNVDDDLERELSFYNQALDAAQQAVRRFEGAGMPWLRPPDYYAEMVKSDNHMARVKEQLMYEQRQIEGADERRKQREAKRFSKEVQAERRKEKDQERKSSIAQVTKLRKQRQKSGFAGELDMDAQLQAMERKPQPASQRIRPGERQVSKKREARDSKYGFGGRKRLGKQNDASSAADMEGYKPGRFEDGFASARGGRGRGGNATSRGRGRGGVHKAGRGRGGAVRPGKSRRAASRGRG